MKKLTTLFLLLTSLSVFSQIPSYYNDVNLNQTGTALKDALAIKIINTHTTNLSYTPGVWDALKQTDLDPTDPTKVLLIYGWNDSDSDITNDRTRGKDVNGGGTGVWNREHVYPKSLANPNLGTSGPGADAHNLRPCDAQRNSSRSNRKFATGSGTDSYITAQGYWYPGDEWKGDVARMIMYMYLRYDSQTLPTGVGIGSSVLSDTNMIDLFLQWNADDPVSDLEKQRNPVLETLQGNRNPFIDNPIFATQIWGGPQAEDLFNNGNDTEAPSIPTNAIASNVTQTTVDLSWTASTDNVGVVSYDILNGASIVGNATNTNYTVTGLTASTAYAFSIQAKDAAGNTSNASSTVNVTTQPGSGNGTTTELLFSEYVEGSSNNKALEIANFTGSSVDLSIYTIKKQTNGAGSWSGALALSGQLAHGNVFVVANGNASSAVTSVANLTATSSQMTFNGNDAVGLFKNNVLIDILGTFDGGTSNYAQNVTLQRKSSITSPNTTYTTSEWDTLATDTFSGLGNHTIDGGSTPDTEAPTAPTNLIAANITETTIDLSWTAATDNTAVTGYDVYQGANIIATVTSTNHQVSGLSVVTAYTFSIKAKDAAGNESVASNVVNASTIDTTAPSIPTNAIASNVTQTTVALSWTASTDNVGVVSYDILNGASIVGNATNTNYTVTGLTASTAYAFSIQAKDAAGNTSNASSTVNVTTSQNSVTYCSSQGNNVNYEYIDNVVLGGISNSTSANSGYGDFTSQIGNLSYGNNTIIVSAGFTGSSYTENWSVWIDYNKNGTFESSEQAVTGSSSSAGNLSYSFSVPSSALLGNTRMRVSMKWNGAPTSCEIFSYGEVEDYTVNIGGSSARGTLNTVIVDAELSEETKIFEASVYPNPATDFINIQLRDSRDANFKIVNLFGQTVRSGQINRNNIRIADLKSGMYIIEVNDGQRSFTKKFMKK